MIRRETSGLRYYQFEGFPLERVSHGVFTRLGGVSKGPFRSLNLSSSVPDEREAVEENRKRFYRAIGVDAACAVRAHQVHGVRVSVVGPADAGHLQRATDGLVTDAHDLALVMTFADCVPVMLFDPVRSVVGIAHAGWRGTAAGMCQAAIARLVSAYGCRPADVRAAIGPSIGPCCYEVGTDVVNAVSAAFGSPDGLFQAGPRGRAHFDQWAAARLALLRAGVLQIEQSGLCTACHVEEFFSHRAERGRTGRFGAFIVLRR